jgi:hypothetical protein
VSASRVALSPALPERLGVVNCRSKDFAKRGQCLGYLQPARPQLPRKEEWQEIQGSLAQVSEAVSALGNPSIGPTHSRSPRGVSRSLGVRVDWYQTNILFGFDKEDK